MTDTKTKVQCLENEKLINVISDEEYIVVQWNDYQYKIKKDKPSKIEVLNLNKKVRNSKGTRLVISLQRRNTAALIKGTCVSRVMTVLNKMITKTFIDFSYIAVSKIAPNGTVISRECFFLKDYKANYNEIKEDSIKHFKEYISSEGIRSLLKHNANPHLVVIAK